MKDFIELINQGLLRVLDYVEGNGLGLAIVKSIVDLHHGKIDILSQVDVGTNFIVRLPIEKQKLIERLKR